ncbi:acyltransferase family protein [Sphingomonas sp.]|uniref:acyltransferase family protein n=1 Tax=Sphingomonas sp. TaxID=28214 RepID=UPI000DB1AAD9|nr:acyltransferase family protein [Sphingomonas sp.]PZU09636.1 MAG: hypothetical protein DI605_08150 [Sphingomonas sp.]
MNSSVGVAMVTNGPDRRQHYWDVTRAFLMLLGLPYHVAMLYHPGGWIVAVDQESTWLGWIAAFIHLFRMPAFFVVAGYFAALLLARRPAGAWIGSRIFRLGIPLLTSLVFLVPVLNMLGELSGRGVHAAFQEWRYQTATSGGYWVRHLWFLIVLLYLSMLSAGVVALFPAVARWRLAGGWDARLARWLPVALLGIGAAIGLFEGIAIELFYKAGLNTNLIQEILRLDDLIGFAPYFLFGAFLQRSPRLTEAFGRPSPTMIAATLGLVAAGIFYADRAWPPVGRFIVALAAIALTQVVISIARALFDRPSRIVERLVAGSFVIYLFHLPILIAIYDVVKRAGLAPGIGFTVNLALTFAFSWGVWRLVERTPALNLLFNGIAPAAPAPRRRAAEPESRAC